MTDHSDADEEPMTTEPALHEGHLMLTVALAQRAAYEERKSRAREEAIRPLFKSTGQHDEALAHHNQVLEALMSRAKHMADR